MKEKLEVNFSIFNKSSKPCTPDKQDLETNREILYAKILNVSSVELGITNKWPKTFARE